MPAGVAIAYVLAFLLVAPGVSASEADREAVLSIARPLVGEREIGPNDGPFVKEVLASVGLGPGHPWCAAFNFYVFREAGFAGRVPRSAWSPDWVRGGRRGNPHKADVFGIYFPAKGRVAHTGLVEVAGETFVTTIEGNTNEAGSREGDGVYRKKRPVRTLILKTYL